MSVAARVKFVKTLFAITVIHAPLLWVAKDLISALYFLELGTQYYHGEFQCTLQGAMYILIS